MFHNFIFTKITDCILNMIKKLPLFFLILSISCYIMFILIGSEIDENGFIKEPFGLLPIGALFFFLSVMIFAWNKIKS